MHVWNVLHAARWKCRTQKIAKNSPSWHRRTTLSRCIFTTMARIDNRNLKLVKQQYLLYMSSQYGELQPTSGWDLLASLGHPSKFQWVSHFGSVTAWHSTGGHQPNFAVLNRGHHLYSAGRPSRWALAPISSSWLFLLTFLVELVFNQSLLLWNDLVPNGVFVKPFGIAGRSFFTGQIFYYLTDIEDHWKNVCYKGLFLLYCSEPVCVSVHIFKTTHPEFKKLKPVAQSSSDDNAICYVLRFCGWRHVCP